MEFVFGYTKFVTWSSVLSLDDRDMEIRVRSGSDRGTCTDKKTRNIAEPESAQDIH